MKQNTVILALLLFCSLQVSAYEERAILEKTATREQVKEALVLNQNWIPYPKQYADRAGWDEFFGEYKDLIIQRGEQYLGYEWKVIKTSWYLQYQRTGRLEPMNAPYNMNRRVLGSLLAAELAEGKGRFLDDIIDGVVHFNEMTSWAITEHLAALSKTNSCVPDETDVVLELTQGYVAQLLSWIYYYLHDEMDKVSPIIAERIKQNLIDREMKPYMETDRFWWMGFNVSKTQVINNWNPWCNYNALLCFMLMENNPDKLADGVYRTMLSVDKYLNWVTSDGACEEGPSYWGHANGKLFCYLRMLSMVTDGKVNLFKMPLLKNMGEYLVRSDVGNGWMVNFADASARSSADAILVYSYGEAVGSDLMKAYAARKMEGKSFKPTDNWYDFCSGMEDIRNSKLMKGQETSYTLPSYTWYPATQFLYYKNNQGLFLAAKGGHNNESHNHNDIGNFILYVNSTPLVIDAGVETYTQKTFSSERYNIWTMQSKYHNLPMINGVMQRYGAEYRSSDVKVNTRKQTFSLNIAGAYPPEAKVQNWTRSYQLNKTSLKVQDTFVLSEVVAPNEMSFMTWGEVSFKQPGLVEIKAQQEGVVLSYDKSMFDVDVEVIKLTDTSLPRVWGTQLQRISLKAKKSTLTGTYSYTFTKL